MLKLLLFLVCTVCLSMVTTFRGFILGPGRWLVLNIELCEHPEQYEFKFDISRKKINRTHDCFDITADLKREFNKTFSIHIDVYKEVDGGFKYYQSFIDGSACAFLMRHAKKNVVRGLTLAGVDPPACPIHPGYIQLRDFVMDYRELPAIGVYGTFEAKVFFLYHKVKVTCIRVLLNFDERHDDDDDLVFL